MKKIFLIVCLCTSILFQAGAVSKTVSVTAGGLYAALTASEKTTITDLTVTGTIDARDLKTMRDNLTSLTKLNMSGATILAYSGKLGTDTISTTYPANEMPKNSFRNIDFSGKTLLTSVTLPSTITSIGAKAFEGCTGLTGMSIPTSVKTIGSYAFYGCTGLTSINIPNSVTSLGSFAFCYCTGLQSVTLPNAITSIGDWTFGSCTSLTGLTIPSTVTSIGVYAFYGCETLTSLILPASVLTIGESAFSKCTGLTGITVPNAVTLIGNSVFSNCSSLSSVNLPKKITSIGDWAFLGCSKLTSVSLSDSLVSIGYGAFYKCTGLTNMTLPKGLTSLNDYAFCNDLGLTSIKTLSPTPLTLLENVFYGVNKTTCTLNVPTNSKTAYQAATVWNEFTNMTEPAPTGSHFTLAYSGNGHDHMNLNILSATIDGVALEAGDEIAAFDDTICCGKVTLTQPINIADVNTFAAIAASKKDVSASNGFTEGHPIKYKYWDASKSKEIDLTTAVYIDINTSQPTSTPNYTANSSAFLKLSGTTNRIPVANAGADLTVNEDSTVTLDGSASSDPDGSTLTYKWTAPSGITLSSSTIAKPNFLAPAVKADTLLTFSLIVNDGTVNSQPDQITVTIKQVNKVPVANAGADQSVNERNSVTLDGSASSDADGSSLTYKWTAPTGITLSSATTAKPSFTAPEVSTDTPFTFGLVVNDGMANSATAQVTVTVKQVYSTQRIPLAAGWNMVSFSVTPTDINIKSIMQPLIDKGKLKKVMDESGKALENFVAFGGWKNDIGNLSQTEGYMVNLTDADTLVVDGKDVALPLGIQLNAGWNIVSYPSLNTQNALTLIQPLIDSGKLKKVMDESGKTIEDFGIYGGWKNNLGNLTSGKGYKVQMTASDVLNITSTTLRSASALKSAPVRSAAVTASYFTTAYEGNGTNHMNINLVDLRSSTIQAGDEIGVFDGEVCVGSAVIGESQLADGNVSIATSCNELQGDSVNGFIPGHAVSLKLYSQGKLFNLSVEKLWGSFTFEKNESLFAKVTSRELTQIGTSVKNTQGESVRIECYPNPFVEEVTVDVQNPGNAQLTVVIFNLSGQKVKTLYNSTGKDGLRLLWNGTDEKGNQVSPGVYLCRINNVTRRIVFNGRQ